MPSPSRRTVLALSLAFVAIVLLRTAWVSDDAYRVLRAVEHAVEGQGLRWNVGERVHIFEEPLWALLLVAARPMGGDAYVAVVALSLICSLWTVLVVLRCGRTDAAIAIGAAVLSLSAAFVTWSSSGAGDPLAHLLVALFAARWLVAASRSSANAEASAANPERRGIHRLLDPASRFADGDGTLWLLAGLAALTRLETLAITAWPLAAQVRARGLRASYARLALLLVPLVAWAVGATWYFGSPVPNPTVARCADAVPWAERIQLGAAFLGDALTRDPLTLAAIVLVVAGTAGRPSRARTLAAGISTYVLLLVVEGGSADAERLLGVALVAATIVVLSDAAIARPSVAGLVLCGIAALGALSVRKTLAADASFGSSAFDTLRVHDARAADYQATGLLRWARERRPPRHAEAMRGAAVRASRATVAVSDRPGFFGFAAGPGVHVIDAHGGGDPFLARLPPAVGTFGYGPRLRRLPDGYGPSKGRGSLTPAEPSLAALAAHVHRMAAGDLTDTQRLLTAWRLATGAYAPLIVESSYGTRTVSLGSLQAARFQGPSSSRPVLEGGVRVELGARQPVRRVELAITGNNDVTVDLMDGSSLVGHLTSRAVAAQRDVLPRSLVASRSAIASALIVRCGRGSTDCRIGYVGVAH